MPNSFLFIIPLTPASHLTASRAHFRRLCLEALRNQNYQNWKALLVGQLTDADPVSDHFVLLSENGTKEEKLQKATAYLENSNLRADYVIRLDDDDIFNSGLLAGLGDKVFDLYVDKYHSFWNGATGKIAQKVLLWFPNTCIHRWEHAFATFGTLPPGNYTHFRASALLIENEHNEFSKYYTSDHTILYAPRHNPVYLRTMSPASFSSSLESDYGTYLSHHGYWKKNRLSGFSYLNKELIEEAGIKDPAQGLLTRLRNGIYNLRTAMGYHRAVTRHSQISRSAS